MKLLKTIAFALTITSAASASAATISLNFSTLPNGSSTNVVVNDFLTISSASSFEIFPFGLQNADLDPIIFTFDTTKVDVSSVSLGGNSNNSPVNIEGFGSLNSTFTSTSSGWSESVTIDGIGSISSISVRLLESGINSFQFDYVDVAAVPVPAAVWLFGSGLFALAGVARRKAA